MSLRAELAVPPACEARFASLWGRRCGIRSASGRALVLTIRCLSRGGIRQTVLGTLLALSVPSSVRVETVRCPSDTPRVEQLASVGARGELAFASGTRAILSGIHWPEAPEAASEARAWLLRYQGKPLTLIARGGEDRWGRLPVDATPQDEPKLDLAGDLIDGGLAQVDAGEHDTLCRADLLAREGPPRQAGGGVWSEPVRDARDAAAFDGSDGRFIVAQGSIRHIGERPSRTYLDFALFGEGGLSVTVPKRTWRIMGERGLTKATLLGRAVRVRGRVAFRRGPILDIVSADMIELLNGEQAQRR